MYTFNQGNEAIQSLFLSRIVYIPPPPIRGSSSETEKFGKRYVAIIAAVMDYTSVSSIGICVNNNNRIITAHGTRRNHESLHAPAVEFLYVFVIPCHYTLRNPIHTPIPSLSHVCACLIVGCKYI